MAVAHEDDFFAELSQRMVATFTVWLEGQEQGQELVSALRLVNDVLERQERGQTVSAEQYQVAYDAAQWLQAVTVVSWKDMHAVFKMVCERFSSQLLSESSIHGESSDEDDEDVLGKWWCDECDAWHAGYYCPKDDDE